MTEEEVRQRYTYPTSRIYRSLQVGYVFPARTAGLRSHRAQSRRTPAGPECCVHGSNALHRRDATEKTATRS